MSRTPSNLPTIVIKFRSMMSPPEVMNGLFSRAEVILDELAQFERFLQENGSSNALDIGSFRDALRNDVKSAERVSKRMSGPDASRSIAEHVVQASNLPFYEAIWETAKSANGLVALRRRFFWAADSVSLPSVVTKELISDPSKRTALVDIVANNGEEWIKVLRVTERRLLFEMANLGLDIESDDDEDAEYQAGNLKATAFSMDPRDTEKNAADDKLEIMQMAEDLQRAADATYIRRNHPRIRLVLPCIIERQTPVVDKIISSIRTMGIQVDCCTSNTSTTHSETPNDRPIDSIFSDLLPAPYPQLSPMLNIDCSILVSLASDISHLKLEPQPTYPYQVNRQITAEATEKLIPSLLYPILFNKTLTCSSLAADKIRQIATHMGTCSEKARVSILLGEGPLATGKSCSELREIFGGYSLHPVPKAIKFPIEIQEPVDLEREIPELSKRSDLQHISDLNKSVFLLGYAKGYTTLTSNKILTRLARNLLDDTSREGSIKGTDFWICEPTRSLLASRN